MGTAIKVGQPSANCGTSLQAEDCHDRPGCEFTRSLLHFVASGPIQSGQPLGCADVRPLPTMVLAGNDAEIDGFAQDRRQPIASLRQAEHQFRAIHANAGKGQSRAAAETQRPASSTKSPRGWCSGLSTSTRCASPCGALGSSGVVVIAMDVGIGRDEGRSRPAATAPGACRRRSPAAPGARATIECARHSRRRRRGLRRQLRPEPAGVDDDVDDAGTLAARADASRSAARPRTSSSALGRVSVSGRIRSPLPAAKIRAFTAQLVLPRAVRMRS